MAFLFLGPNRLASPRVNGYLVKASSNPFTFYDSPLPGVNTPWDVIRIVCNPELMDVAEVVQTFKTEDLSRKLEVNYVKFQFRGGLLGLKDLSRAETYNMTLVHDSIFDPYQLKIKPQIRLPNEDMSVISHVGKVKLNNGIVLKDVLVVPSFKFSLLSVSKLTEDSKSGVSFYPKFCVVQDLTTRKVTGLGSMKEGLYHLANVTHDKIDFVVSKLMQDSMQKFSLSALGNLKFDNKVPRDSYGLWHHRLGHVSDTKLKCMNDLPVSLIKTSSDNCLSCPMAKFTKLPYSSSVSHSTCIFELIHIDIRGPYKVPTNGKFSYFLTIVDDYSRGTWVYLLEQKSDAFDALKFFLKGQCGLIMPWSLLKDSVVLT
ncbi:cysteine-rich receptor-like protein kinase 8 [Tanacetum coccineum]